MVQQTLLESNPPAGTDRYPGMPDTDFADVLTETDKFIQSHPHILELIEEDLDAHARSKKARRINDSNWEIKNALQKEGREGEMEIDPINEEDITLQQGRPRTSAYVVFIGLVCSGYHEKGPVSRSFEDLLLESRSIACMMNRRGKQLPAIKTLWELMDAVSNATRHEIHKAQCEQIIQQDLDDFSMMVLDSTHVKANTAWPTEAGIILKLIERIWRNGNQIEPFGYENFQPFWTETWIDKIKTDLFKINTADNKATRKKHYKRVYHFAEGAHDHLDEERKKFEKKVRPEQIKPSRREKLNQLRDQIRQDLSDLKKVISYSKKRVLKGESTPVPEKVLSEGKKMLGRDTYYRAAYWDARDKRSAMESTISVMKGAPKQEVIRKMKLIADG